MTNVRKCTSVCCCDNGNVTVTWWAWLWRGMDGFGPVCNNVITSFCSITTSVAVAPSPGIVGPLQIFKIESVLLLSVKGLNVDGMAKSNKKVMIQDFFAIKQIGLTNTKGQSFHT